MESTRRTPTGTGLTTGRVSQVTRQLFSGHGIVPARVSLPGRGKKAQDKGDTCQHKEPDKPCQ